jgi:hypothetical protein
MSEIIEDFEFWAGHRDLSLLVIELLVNGPGTGMFELKIPTM